MYLLNDARNSSLRYAVVVASVVMVELAPTDVHAQTTAGPQSRKQWSLGVSFQETGGDNLRFVTAPDEGSGDLQSIITDSLTTRLSFGSVSRRFQMALDGWASANVVSRDLSSRWPSYGGSFLLSYQGSRFGAHVSQAASSGLNSGSLATIGVVPTRIDSWRLETLGGISYRISSRTSFSIDFTYDRTGFENPTSLDSSLVVLERPPFEQDLSNVLPEPPPPEEGAEPELPKPPDSQNFILDVIASEGLLYPNLSSESGGASFGFQHQISSRTRFSLGLNAGYRTFDSVDQSRLLTNGFSYGGSASLSRLLTPRDSLFIQYRGRKNSAQVPAVFQHTATLGWGRVLRRRFPKLDLQASGGVGYLRAAEVSFDDVVPVADVGVIAEVTRSTSLGANFRSGHNETLGFGQNLRTNYISANFSQSIGSRLQVSMSAGYAVGKGLVNQDFKSEGARYGAAVFFAVIDNLRVEATYQRVGRQSQFRELGGTTNDLWTVNVSYGHYWPPQG